MENFKYPLPTVLFCLSFMTIVKLEDKLRSTKTRFKANFLEKFIPKVLTLQD